MITCIIEYDICPTQRADFDAYARLWHEAIPRCGADLVGYYAPHEGSITRGFGIYNIPSLAAYEAYKQRLSEDETAREAFALAQSRGFLRGETRAFYRPVAGPNLSMG